MSRASYILLVNSCNQRKYIAVGACHFTRSPFPAIFQKPVHLDQFRPFVWFSIDFMPSIFVNSVQMIKNFLETDFFFPNTIDFRDRMDKLYKQGLDKRLSEKYTFHGEFQDCSHPFWLHGNPIGNFDTSKVNFAIFLQLIEMIFSAPVIHKGIFSQNVQAKNSYPQLYISCVWYIDCEIFHTNSVYFDFHMVVELFYTWNIASLEWFLTNLLSDVPVHQLRLLAIS